MRPACGLAARAAGLAARAAGLAARAAAARSAADDRSDLSEADNRAAADAVLAVTKTLFGYGFNLLTADRGW